MFWCQDSQTLTFLGALECSHQCFIVLLDVVVVKELSKQHTGCPGRMGRTYPSNIHQQLSNFSLDPFLFVVPTKQALDGFEFFLFLNDKRYK